MLIINEFNVEILNKFWEFRQYDILVGRNHNSKVNKIKKEFLNERSI